LGSRHHSLDLSEIADITDMLSGFQEHNSCRIMMLVRVEVTKRERGLVIEAIAYPMEGECTVATQLASVNVKCSTMNLRAWNSALTHVMYALDFQLALNELGHAAPKSV
jgi:hypothetical protein